MTERVEFINEKNRSVEIIIEPSAEEIELPPGKTVSFEISQDLKEFRDAYTIAYHDDAIVVYEQRGRVMKIFIDGTLKFSNA